MGIMEGNAVAPSLLADLFKDWMCLAGVESAECSELTECASLGWRVLSTVS